MHPIAEARSVARHRGKSRRELRAELDELNKHFAELGTAYNILHAGYGQLEATHEQAMGAAARRIAELTEQLATAQRAAELNAHPLHVAAIGERPADPDGEVTQPMDCRALRIAVGAADNPREHWARPVTPVVPLRQAPFAATRAGHVDSDTTLTIPLPHAA